MVGMPRRRQTSYQASRLSAAEEAVDNWTSPGDIDSSADAMIWLVGKCDVKTLAAQVGASRNGLYTTYGH